MSLVVCATLCGRLGGSGGRVVGLGVEGLGVFSILPWNGESLWVRFCEVGGGAGLDTVGLGLVGLAGGLVCMLQLLVLAMCGLGMSQLGAGIHDWAGGGRAFA